MIEVMAKLLTRCAVVGGGEVIFGAAAAVAWNNITPPQFAVDRFPETESRLFRCWPIPGN